MARLILLNGPPASGKSTIAQRYVNDNPLALDLDIDVVRGQMDGWLADPITAGNAARKLALSQAETHLDGGHNVIVPQFLGRPDFVDALADVADRTQAEFIETALWIDRQSAIDAFDRRSADPQTQSHRDAAALVERSESSDPVGEMHDAFVDLIDARQATWRIDVTVGDIERTYADFIAAITTAP